MARLMPQFEDVSTEPEQILRELEHMVAYWERQAELAKLPSRAAAFLRKRDRCLEMADQVRHEKLCAGPGVVRRPS